MFRRRLTLALTLLAAAVVAQALGAAAMQDVAERHVQRGRVASDIAQGFVELAGTKHRLRTWVAQLQQGAGAEPALRDALQAEMRQTLERLETLALAARALDPGAARRADHAARQDALAVLARSLAELEQAVAGVAPLTEGADARQAWEALSRVFDLSQGQDLRQLLGKSIEREAAAVEREREAADASLGQMRALWLGMGGALALAALLAALYFTRALRRPLDALERGTEALQRGELQHRIALEGADEFAALAGHVNQMAAELEQHRAHDARRRQDLQALVEARTAELQHALATLQQADARRRRLFADIGHELRTPTTAIRGEAEITLRGADRSPAEYRAALQRIVQTTRQLALVIDDLLGMARTDLEALSLQRRRVDLAEPLARALEQAGTLATERGVHLQPPPALPPCPLWADPQRLQQLLTVLLDNAIRYSHREGTVRVQLLPTPGTDTPSARPRGATLTLEVADEGIGIPLEELPQVFERHFRGEAARRHRADGMGLGLAIAQALAAAHGGQLTLHSEPGRGTRARLQLPLHDEALDGEPPSDAAAGAANGAAPGDGGAPRAADTAGKVCPPAAAPALLPR